MGSIPSKRATAPRFAPRRPAPTKRHSYFWDAGRLCKLPEKPENIKKVIFNAWYKAMKNAQARRRDKAAISLQKGARGYKARKVVEKEKVLKPHRDNGSSHLAVLKLQNTFRSHVAKRAVGVKRDAEKRRQMKRAIMNSQAASGEWTKMFSEADAATQTANVLPEDNNAVLLRLGHCLGLNSSAATSIDGLEATLATLLWQRELLFSLCSKFASATLPKGWSCFIDLNYGRPYYVHSSGQTTWERPLLGQLAASAAASECAHGTSGVQIPTHKQSMHMMHEYDLGRQPGGAQVQVRSFPNNRLSKEGQPYSISTHGEHARAGEWPVEDEKLETKHMAQTSGPFTLPMSSSSS